jgi:phosphatidylinositol-bisphosphatase
VAVPNPTTLTFVNTHLAAFDEMVEKRNSDFHELSRRLLFENESLTSALQAPNSDDDDQSASPHSQGEFYDAEMFGFDVNAPLSIYETDALFWLVSLFTPFKCALVNLCNREVSRLYRAAS